MFRKIRRELSYSLGWGGAPPPDSVTIEVNYDCNFRCPSCQLWTKEFKVARIGRTRILTLAELEKIIKELRGLGVKSVHFGGGEPFVRKDFLEIVKCCKSHGMATSAFTNAFLINDALAQRIVDSGIDSLGVSMDGPDSEIDDKLRGVEGAFDHAVRGIQVLKEYQKRLGTELPDLSIHCTVSAANFLSLPRMVDVARSLGVRRIGFQYVSVVSNEVKSETNRMIGETVIDKHTFADLPSTVLLSKDQLDNFGHVMASIQERAGSEVEFELDPAFLRGDKNLLEKGIFPVSACKLPWREAIISPIGDVLPCSMYTAYKMGNLRESTFEDVWNGKRAKHIRKQLSGNLPPLCQHCCVVHESEAPLWKRVYSKVQKRFIDKSPSLQAKQRGREASPSVLS